MLTLEQRPAELLMRATDFCRALRSRGVIATPTETIVLARTLGLIDFADRTEVLLAFRAVLATRFADLAIVDEAFAEWWPADDPGPMQLTRRSAGSATPRLHDSTSARLSDTADAPGGWAASANAGGDSLSIAMPSARESIGRRDFAAFGTDDVAAVERAAARLARRLKARPSRRWRSARRGDRIDLRRLTRISLKTGGDPVELARRDRKLRRTRLVVLCDVSGSMDIYSRFLLQVLYALQRAFAGVETFAFSTRLARISDSLARNTYPEALDALAREQRAGWSGGTKIGESIAAFNARWGLLIGRRTIVIVLSDGWDTGNPELLADALSTIHRRAGRVVWLNPLLGDRNYKPLTRGMQAALPHVDVFAPAHNLAALETLAEHLRL